jgi:hypothetical protein
MPKHGKKVRPTASKTPSTRLEVRPEATRGSGEKAARRDLESRQPLGKRSGFQSGLKAAHEEAAHSRLESAAADIGEVDEELADIERQQGWRLKDIESADEKLNEAIANRNALPQPRRFPGMISTFAYVVIMGLFAACEYPLMRLSLVRLPVDDWTIKVIALLLGATLVAGVHVLALATARVVQPEGDRIEGRRDWFAHVGVIVAGLVFYVFVVVGLAWVRAGEINGIDKAFTGEGMRHPVWFGVALGFFHAATLLAAFYVSYHRARAAEWRAAQQLVETRTEDKETAETALEELDRREARLHVRREGIIDRADRDLEQLQKHHLGEEHAYLAILARELDAPPKPIDDWDISRTPRGRCVVPVRTLNVVVHKNGNPDSDTKERLRRSVSMN